MCGGGISMWVRTQDKEKFLKVDFFELDETSIYCNIANGGYNYVFLGQYSTKEKALKVLDMIQEFIKGQKESYYAYKDNKEIVNHYYYPNKEQLVFQMPQDSEVE
jgi:hypothetical protein